MKRLSHNSSIFLLCFFFLIGTPHANDKKSEKNISEQETDIKDISPEKQYLNVFRKLFYSNTYNSLKCHENIYNLLKKAKAENLAFTDVNVIFIFDKDHDKLLNTKSDKTIGFGVQRPKITMYKTRRVYNRSDPPGQFRFHAFAAYQDKIMDFDYTNSPKLVPAEEYFKEMFSTKEMHWKEQKKLYKQLALRVISAKDYFNSFPKHTSWYLFDLEKKFPAQSLKNYLQSLQNNKDQKKNSPSQQPVKQDQQLTVP